MLQEEALYFFFCSKSSTVAFSTDSVELAALRKRCDIFSLTNASHLRPFSRQSRRSAFSCNSRSFSASFSCCFFAQRSWTRCGWVRFCARCRDMHSESLGGTTFPFGSVSGVIPCHESTASVILPSRMYSPKRAGKALMIASHSPTETERLVVPNIIWNASGND